MILDVVSVPPNKRMQPTGRGEPALGSGRHPPRGQAAVRLSFITERAQNGHNQAAK